MVLISLSLVLLLTISSHGTTDGWVKGVRNKTGTRRYENKWSSLDSRPAPEWFDRDKIGVMVHWGVYSVPAFSAENQSTEWFWHSWKNGNPEVLKFMEHVFPSVKSYEGLAPLFIADLFDADVWAKMFASAGAKYVVLTTKQHDGYALFPSIASEGWEATSVGPMLDLVNEVAGAASSAGLKFGAHYTLYENFDENYLRDVQSFFSSQIFPITKLWPDLYQLVVEYKPKILWIDTGKYNTTSNLYGNWKGFLAWLYNSSPVKDDVVVNDRWTPESVCQHGDFFTCGDHYWPTTLPAHKWESRFSLDRRSWGYRRDMKNEDVVTTREIIWRLVRTVSLGGNILINVGATKEGLIPDIFRDRFRELGSWMRINGKAIYKTSPWFYQQDEVSPTVWYTCVKVPYNATHPTSVPMNSDVIKTVYAIFLEWPVDNIVRLKAASVLHLISDYIIQLLEGKITLYWKMSADRLEVLLPARSSVRSDHAWVLRFVKGRQA